MDSVASNPLQLIAPASGPATSQQTEAAPLSGEDFLQMLAIFGASLGDASTAATDPVETEQPAPGAFDASLQWLPLGGFVASAWADAVQEEAPTSSVTPRASALPDQAAAALSDVAGEAVSESVDPLASLFEELASLSGERTSPNTLHAPLTGAAMVAAALTERTAAPLQPQALLQQPIRSPLHSPHWSQEVGQRIALMAVNGQQSGSLSLSPEHLGPVEVRIQVSQDSAQVWFAAQHADTRAALSEALPRLREMFSANGLSLGEAQVSQHAPRQQTDGQGSYRGGTGSDDSASPTPVSITRLRLGLVDTYA